MPKLYYPTPDELQGATPLHEGGWGCDNNRGTWFDVYQPILLRLANTIYGRDLFCIDSWEKQPYPIVRINKNSVTYFIGCWGGERHFRIDARIGAKYGNVVRERWVHVKQALDKMNLRMIMEMPQYFMRGDKRIPVLMGASEITAYPDPDTETTTVDGWTRHVLNNSTWTTLVNAAGNAYSDTIASAVFIKQATSISSNTFSQLYRPIFLFDTSSIGAGDIDSAVLSLRGRTKVDENTADTPNISIYTSNPASSTALEAADYTSLGSAAQSDVITYSAWSTSGYNDFTFNGTGEGSISKSGVSKFGARDPRFDVPDTTPSGTWSSNGEESMGGDYADTTGTTTDPKLVVNYTLPFTPRAIMF